jgi:transglutaminase-like putative cysteine protease
MKDFKAFPTMTTHRRSKVAILIVLFIIACIVVFVAVSYADTGKRTVRLEYSFEMEALPAGAQKVRVWVPLPPVLPSQDIDGLKVDAPASYTIESEPVWGNRSIFFEVDSEAVASVFSMEFTVTRREVKAAHKSSGLAPLKEKLMKYLRPSRLGPHTDAVKSLASNAVKGNGDATVKARHIYDFVLKNMDYNKNKPGWGRGDVSRLCLAIAGGEKGTGNCTDFHSFFAALLQTQNIPVLFEMGYPLKPGSGATDGGYHCWASFYTQDAGWVPVDISEADKAPALVDYYFGSIDENRVTFSRGRDVVLNPAQAGEPLNYFGPDPYIEVDGRPFKGFKRTITYTNI